ncbi:MAG: DUF6452 family protein [Bacteroidaceae bacterium]
MKYTKRAISMLVLAVTTLVSCDSIDCTLYNTVSLSCTFFSEGNAVKLTDTLTVSAFGTDSILINRVVGVASLELPLSYRQEQDTIVLHLYGEGYDMHDTLWIEKSDITHFESPDCPTAMFHQIISVEHTHNIIDSIIIIRSLVDYDQTENIRIHL